MFIIFFFIIGGILGSFLCTAAERIPLKQSILTPGSHCGFCKESLLKRDLLPIFSSLLLHFRCRFCHKRIPLAYFFSECISGLLFVMYLTQDFSPQQMLNLCLFLFILTLSLTDCFYFIVEPRIFYSAGLGIYSAHYFLRNPFYPTECLFLVLSLILLTRLLPDTIGGGDIWFIGFLGLLFDLLTILQVLFIASILGILFFAAWNFFSKKKLVRLPFVPFLGIGLFLSLLI